MPSSVCFTPAPHAPPLALSLSPSFSGSHRSQPSPPRIPGSTSRLPEMPTAKRLFWSPGTKNTAPRNPARCSAKSSVSDLVSIARSTSRSIRRPASSIPTDQKNIPGLEQLDNADLLIIATRFRQSPADQLAHIEAFLNKGKPVIGLRTSTHAFTGDAKSGGFKWAEFGLKILGEQLGRPPRQAQGRRLPGRDRLRRTRDTK